MTLEDGKVYRYGEKKGLQARYKIEGKELHIAILGTNHLSEWFIHARFLRMKKSVIRPGLKMQRSWAIPAMKLHRHLKQIENEYACVFISGCSWGGVTASFLSLAYLKKVPVYCFMYDSPRPYNKRVSVGHHYINRYSIVNKWPFWRPPLGYIKQTGNFYVNPIKNHTEFNKPFYF